MTAAQDHVVPTDLSNEMSRSYLEYAMSVIVGRALPDARDGLKPVHRRILYAMYELGLTPDRPFRKCARVVGEVLGKYHPHGDTAVYDALVRMAQDFSMRDPLINGHGNFGSIDNDPPAAMRYTECRLHTLATNALLQDIESETVDFADNFDGSQQEPVVLPSRVPQLLINGSSGIAVGMATNIPPHNLAEIIDGTVALIHNPDLTDTELQRYIPGPDFPTGGHILGRDGIQEAYTTGRGSITLRGVASFETIEQRGRPDRDAIIITELPYQTNKAALIEKIADLVNDRKIDGISDVRDESDRDGIRVALIRSAADTASAKEGLVQNFGLSEVQADAILQMQLRRLTALESEKIQQEHGELLTKIGDLQDILARKERIDSIIEEELQQIKTIHSTPRRTHIEQREGEIAETDLIANEQALILVTEQGYIKRMPVNTFESQNRATRGKAGAKMKEDDGIDHFITCRDHDSVLFFTDRGVVYSLNAYHIPTGSRTARGVPIVQLLEIPKGEKITSVVAVSEFSEDNYLIMLTQKGFIKKTALAAFSNIRSNGLIAISLEDGDQLRWVRLAKEEDSVIIGSRQGMAIHFKADSQQLRSLGRATKGVKSMKLRSGDELISMDILPSQIVAQIAESNEEETEDESEEINPEVANNGPWVLAITMAGLGKRVPVTLLRLQNRAGLGVRVIKFRKKNDKLAALHVVNPHEEFMIITA